MLQHATAAVETRVAEFGRVFVTNGSMICPHPSLCDIGEGETYDEYVLRHCLDHNLGEFDTLEDAERNLGVWCLYFCARHVLKNPSLGVGARIVAHWEPCWEDAFYLANWTLSPKDTEQDVEWEERTFRLKPYAEQDTAAVYKRFKKLTKARDTQKTSWGKAYITFRQLHAYYVEDRPNFRVLVISGTSTLAREHYLQVLADLWETHETLTRLYGATVYTKRYHALAARGRATEDQLEAETRQQCLLAKGSRPKDSLRMRWIVKQKDSSGLSAISLKVAGMETTTTGNRWDLVVVDDPITPENVTTEASRKKVERKIADLRKQGDADSEFLYLNTPYHVDDASSRIDREQGDQYHIIYRPAMWLENGEERYYWQYNALPPGNPPPGKPPRNAVWPPSRIREEEHLPDFHSQVLLRARDESKLDFSEEDFPIVDAERAPLEVRAGLDGKPISKEDADWLASENVEIRGYVLVDPSGNDGKSKRGDDTWITAGRLDRFGDFWIVQMAAGQFNTSQEEQAVYDAWLYSGAQNMNYEVSSSGKKWVKRGYAEFQAKKSQDLKRPVSMPIHFRDAAETKSKYIRMDRMHPFIKAGRLKILGNVAKPIVRKFINQWIDRGTPGGSHDDGPDSASMIQYYIDVATQYTETAIDRPEETVKIEGGVLSFSSDLIFKHVQETMNADSDGRSWGERG